MRINEYKVKKLTVILLVGLVMLFPVIFLLRDKQAFSENENRYLAVMPEFSLESVKSGEYMEALTDYCSDHFPFRDFL